MTHIKTIVWPQVSGSLKHISFHDVEGPTAAYRPVTCSGISCKASDITLIMALGWILIRDTVHDYPMSCISLVCLATQASLCGIKEDPKSPQHTGSGKNRIK